MSDCRKLATVLSESDDAAPEEQMQVWQSIKDGMSADDCCGFFLTLSAVSTFAAFDDFISARLVKHTATSSQKRALTKCVELVKALHANSL
eukprot:4125384-Alexandrium_andersonii.AAC.1